MSRDKHEAFKVRHRQSEQPRRPMCETLEDRLLFIAYTVTGTNGNDSISISISGNSIISVVNGVSDSGSDIINNEIEIFGLGGDDTISIIETGANTVTVDGGSSDDTINIGNGGNDLDNIDDLVTVIGSTGTDSVVLHDQNNTTLANYRLSSGNIYTRGGGPAMTLNVENVRINGPTSAAASGNLVVDDPPSAAVTANLPSSATNFVVLEGLGTRIGAYSPSGTTLGTGSVNVGVSIIEFSGVDFVSVNDFANFSLVTPNANDTVSLTGGASTVVNGNSNGVPWTTMSVASTGTLTLNLATNDGGAGNDSVTGSGGHGGANTLVINSGTGNNALIPNGGNWNVSSLGGALDVFASGATTSVNFAGSQSIRRLEVNNSSDASVSGSLATLNIQQLAVDVGDGGISASTGTTINVTNTFSIAATQVLTKGGGGTLNINATQSHGAGSGFQNNAGTTNFNTNGGSTASRTLNVFSNQGLINFNSTQHLNGLGNNFGNIVVGANGSRMIIVSSLGIGGEGGTFNLNDNDMVVDYSGASPYAGIRQHIVNGFNAGNWNGLGIGSGSAAAAAASPNKTGLGYAEATQIFNSFPASFVGQQVDNTSILIRYTLLGNSDLNNTTDISDFAFLASNFNTPGDWRDGDYTYDGIINISDFSLQASNFNKVFAGDLPRMLSSGTRAAGSPFAQQRLIELMTDDGSLKA